MFLWGKRGKILKNNNVYFVSVISKILLTFLTLINSILINRYLGPTLMGQYSLMINITSITALLLGLNITSSYAFFNRKYGNVAQTKLTNIIYGQLFVSIILGLAVYLLVPNNKMIFFTILFTIIQQFNNQIDFLGILIDVNKRNKFLLISSIGYSLLLLSIYLFTEVNIDYVFYALITFNLLKIILLIFNDRIYPRKLPSNVGPQFLEIIKYSSLSMYNDLLTNLNYNLDIIILGFFVDSDRIGIYSLAVSLASMTWIIPNAFKEVLFNRTKNDDSLGEISFIIKLNVYISIPILIAFIIIGKVLIKLLYGTEFIDSYVITIVLLLGSVPMIFFKMINTLYLSNGNQRISAVVLSIALFLETVLNILFIPQFGIIAAALSSVVSYIISGGIMLYSFRKVYSIPIKKLFVFDKFEIEKISFLIKKFIR